MNRVNYIKENYLITELDLINLNKTGAIYNKIVSLKNEELILSTNKGNTIEELCESLIDFIKSPGFEIVGGVCKAKIFRDNQGHYILFGTPITFPEEICTLH
ncbi:MAG: hypothetical protein ACOC1K_00245 [Nanoarchaeota archaeon]